MSVDPIKLLFAGPVGAGKTAALRALSDVAPVSSEVPLSEGASAEKTTTTVAFDYSTVRIDDDVSIHLYGIPGQDHFSFMRPIIAKGALGAIVLLDATAADLGAQCEYWLRSMREANPELLFVVGISKTDLAPQFSMGDVRDSLKRCGLIAPVLRVDARDRESCRHLVRALLASIEAHYVDG